MMTVRAGVIRRAWARAAARCGAAWAGMERAWAAARRSWTSAARGLGDGGEDDVVPVSIAAAIGVGVRRRSRRGGRGCWDISSERSLSRRQEKMRVRGLGWGKGCDGGAEGPGSGGVVGYVEEEIGGEEFQAAGPCGVADSGFYGGVWDVVTDSGCLGKDRLRWCGVNCKLLLLLIVFVGSRSSIDGGQGEGQVALLVDGRVAGSRPGGGSRWTEARGCSGWRGARGRG